MPTISSLRLPARVRSEQGGLDDMRGMDRVYLCFALGKALEDRGDHVSPLGLTSARNRSNARPSVVAPPPEIVSMNMLQAICGGLGA
jgi:hypothetical protein